MKIGTFQNNLKISLVRVRWYNRKKSRGIFMRVSKPSKPRAKEVMKPKKASYSSGKASRPAPTRKGR